MISKDKIRELFDTDIGKSIYSAAERAMKDNSMTQSLNKGVLVGLSGGADSVMLLLLLLEYSRRNGAFKILPVHINHMIRGEEADRDESFSRILAESLGLEFVSVRIDVPQLASELGIGIEEAARNARYNEFSNIISGRIDISSIAVAHNATDNLETVIMNMLRGTGTHGLSGIMPVRENIIRPLIYSKKEDILRALDFAGIEYVTDSTNLSSDYKRNYVRLEILPRLREIAPAVEDAVTRLSTNLRSDDEYILEVAKRFLSENSKCGAVSKKPLSALPYAVFSRVIKLMATESALNLMQTHISNIYELLSGGDFSLSVPGGKDFVCEGDECAFLSKTEMSAYSFSYELSMGINEFPDLFGAVIVSDTPINETSLNVYKISIQQCIDFDIINGRLLMRSKVDGDSYSYGKMTHKLKKLFNDKSVPRRYRTLVPVICDQDSILWVPGFGIRDDASGKRAERKIYIALAYPKDKKCLENQHRLVSGSDFL